MNSCSVNNILVSFFDLDSIAVKLKRETDGTFHVVIVYLTQYGQHSKSYKKYE